MYCSVGTVWGNLGEPKKAIDDYYLKALDIILNVYGDKHPRVAAIYNNLGAAWDRLGEHQKALDYYTKALDIDLKVYGDKHPDVARDYNNLGVAWYGLGGYWVATWSFIKTLEISSQILGPDHPYTKVTKASLKFVEEKLKESEAAPQTSVTK